MNIYRVVLYPPKLAHLLVLILLVLNNSYVQSYEYSSSSSSISSSSNSFSKSKINIEEYRESLERSGGKRDLERDIAINKYYIEPNTLEDTKDYNMTYVDVFWYGGKYINCPFNCTVNATSFACSPDENGQTRGDWNDGKQTFQDPLPVGSTLKAVGFELLGTFNCASDSSVKTQLLILLQGEEIGNIFTVSAESTCMCANCYTNVTIPSYPVIVPLYNYSGINMLSINVMKNGICLFNVRTFLYYSLPAPITTATSSATATTSTASTSTTGGLTTTATTSSGPSTTGGGKNTPKGGLTTKQWAIIASSVTGGALVFILLFVYVRQKIARVGYVELKEGKNIDIGEIKLGERIGKGNFGEVFKGHWRGAVVAIKKLPAHNITETVMKEFHREIDLMKNLRHPNVIQFLGSCTIPPNICICTEYMPKGSLYGILHDPSVVIQWSLLKKMCMDAAKGIIYLHNSNPVILHRDLKSHNLLVDENFKVKVADFGLSTIEQTATMTACGTPCWTAPEVLRNQRYTEKADVYSFGIVMWECATRSDPYSGMPPFQVIFAVGREGLRPPIPRNCPPDFVALMTDCWAENADSRPSMETVLNKLEALEVTGWPDLAVPR